MQLKENRKTINFLGKLLTISDPEQLLLIRAQKGLKKQIQPSPFSFPGDVQNRSSSVTGFELTKNTGMQKAIQSCGEIGAYLFCSSLEHEPLFTIT